MAPTLERIWLYPIKALDGVAVSKARFHQAGGLELDRAWVLRRERDGKIVNGKRDARVHRIRAQFNLVELTAQLKTPGTQTRQISLAGSLEAASLWFSEVFKERVTLESVPKGCPDDTVNPGPTVISEASLVAVSRWFEGLSPEQIERRLRTNLVVSGTEAFWEDTLLVKGAARGFTIGKTTLLATNPCQRCVVPARDADTGEVWPGFQKTFMKARSASMPENVERDCFDHMYRLALNTQTPNNTLGKEIETGDPIGTAG